MDEFDGEVFVYSVYLVFHARKRLPTALRLGRSSEPLWTRGWKELRTGDKVFDAAFHTWTKNPEKGRALLSKPARSSFFEVAELHPGVHLFVDGKEVTLNRPGTDFDRNLLAAFVLKAVACVEQILAEA